MIKKLLRKWGLSGSEKHIKLFLDLFSQGDTVQNGMVLGWAALFHHQIMTKDPEFERLLNSKKGENQGQISSYILQLNRFENDLREAGRTEEAAGIMFLNITFRCMSDEALHHYGTFLWKTASKSFSGAKLWLENRFAYAIDSGSDRDTANLRAALKIYDFIPPQFRDEQ